MKLLYIVIHAGGWIFREKKYSMSDFSNSSGKNELNISSKKNRTEILK